jgi:hypothetical protein
MGGPREVEASRSLRLWGERGKESEQGSLECIRCTWELELDALSLLPAPHSLVRAAAPPMKSPQGRWGGGRTPKPREVVVWIQVTSSKRVPKGELQEQVGSHQRKGGGDLDRMSGKSLLGSRTGDLETNGW